MSPLKPLSMQNGVFRVIGDVVLTKSGVVSLAQPDSMLCHCGFAQDSSAGLVESQLCFESKARCIDTATMPSDAR